MKTCRVCKNFLSLDRFSVNRRNRDGLQDECKGCYSTIQYVGRRRRDSSLIERERARLSVGPGMKRCTGCGAEKPISDFEKHKTGRDGLRGRCRACAKAQRRTYHATRWINRKPRLQKQHEDYYLKSPRTVLRMALANALRRRPTENPATLDDILALWDLQKGCCALSGIKMTWGSGAGSPQPTSISLDRIDRFGGYKKDNVQLVCYSINNFKSIMPESEMDLMLETFYRYRLAAKDCPVHCLLNEAA